MKLMRHSMISASQRYVQRSPESVELAFEQLTALNLKGARVAKSADAKDLKSFFRQRKCGFNSRPGHQNICGIEERFIFLV